VVFEIGEPKIGKRKYNRRHLVDGTWILGMIVMSEGSVRGGRYRLSEEKFGLNFAPITNEMQQL
jgi:hypothetical protein